MNFVAILCMHGELSSNFIKSIEIILGKQNNLFNINFNNEDFDELEKKYNDILNNFNFEKDFIICMTDIWGGIPFNMSNKILKNSKYNFSILSGLNIPMLLDFVMINKNKDNISDLLNSIVDSGKIGINFYIKD